VVNPKLSFCSSIQLVKWRDVLIFRAGTLVIDLPAFEVGSGIATIEW